MFNESNYHAGNHTNNLNVNAVTGAILKNHTKSWFERFHLNSHRAKELLVEGGHHSYVSERDITVLQMVICGDMEVLAELVYTNDYKKAISDDA